MYVPWQRTESTHLPSINTRPSGQKQPSAHPLGQFDDPILSHV